MSTYAITYLSIIGFGGIFLVIYYLMLGKAAENLPNTWKKSLPSKKFRISILFLAIYLLIDFTGETIAIYLAEHGIYNFFVQNINETLFMPFLFGFFFIHTSTRWKRTIYLILYAIFVIYLVSNGYYHPRSVSSSPSALIFFGICFLGALIHLTDLLENPKSEHFKFQLKINLCLLINSLLATILTSFYLLHINTDFIYSDLFYYIHAYNIMLYYFALDLIFIHEILKFRRT